jgi:hypothetical protein
MRTQQRNSTATAPNALHPARMTAPERLAEAADLLATALVRLRSRKSSPLSAHRGECSLHFLPDQSGGVARENKRETRS